MTTLTPSFHDKLMAAAVVLDNPVGMVQELNATRLMFVESRQRYLGDPRIARPLLISQSIMGLKALIGEQTAKAVADEEAAKGLPMYRARPIRSRTTCRARAAPSPSRRRAGARRRQGDEPVELAAEALPRERACCLR